MGIFHPYYTSIFRFNNHKYYDKKAKIPLDYSKGIEVYLFNGYYKKNSITEP